MSDAIQIGQCEQRMHLSKVFGDAAVAHFGMAPQPLDHQIGMLANRTHFGIAPVARALTLSQRLELTRFRGHLILGKEGVHDAEVARPIRT